MTNEQKLEKFNLAIDEIMEAKFILADVKIGKLISVMAEEDELYSLLANVLKGFDFDVDGQKYFLDSRIELPKKPRDLVAFVFCLLVSLNQKKIALYDFLHQYFLTDNINSSYLKFVKDVVLPFKDVITQTLVGEGEKDLGPAPKTKAEILYDICDEIRKNCASFTGTENAYIILGAMKDACRRDEMPLFEALKIALFNSFKNRKFLKYLKNALSDLD